MLTVEVPREAWAQALNEFNAIHEGWLVSLSDPRSALNLKSTTCRYLGSQSTRPTTLTPL